jgi:hypothetical protein
MEDREEIDALLAFVTRNVKLSHKKRSKGCVAVKSWKKPTPPLDDVLIIQRQSNALLALLAAPSRILAIDPTSAPTGRS